MDKRIANNLIVGIFVVVGVCMFVWVLFKIDGGQGLFSSEQLLYAKFNQVKGVNYGSEVSLMGVRVGTVKKVSVMDPKTKELLVEFAVNKEHWDKIRQDSTATLKTSGVLGDKYLEISIGDHTLPELKNGDFIKSSEPDDIMNKAGNLVGDIGKQFAKGGDIEGLMKNLNKVAANLVYLTDEMKSGKGVAKEVISGNSGAKLNKALEHLANIMRKIDNGDGTLGAIINDPTIYEDVKSMMGGAKRSSILQYFMKSFIDTGADAEKEAKPKKK